MWDNPLVHRHHELKALRDAIKEELIAFREDTEFRKTEEESQIFVELLKIAIHLDVVTDRKLSEDLVFEVSTVARWRKGDSVPPKRKQIQILEFILAQISDAERRLLKQQVEMKRTMDKLVRLRGGKVSA